MSAALLDGTSAEAVLVLSIVAALGLALGAVRVRGVSLGIAGVLFVGLAFGHFGVHVEERTREFARELGLVLFVYSIGCRWAPGSSPPSAGTACASTCWRRPSWCSEQP